MDGADAPGSAPVPTPATPPVGKGRKARVRNRLVIAVAVVAAAVAGAGAPAILTASGQVSESQGLVDDAQRTQSALALSHSLADERDEVTAFIAAGRPKGKGLSEEHSGRVDRQVEELRATAEGSLTRTLDEIAAVRRAALTGKETALKANTSYSAAITDLHRLAERLADDLPARAGAGGHALADLDRAVDQASAARGLLLAAYAVPRPTTSTTVLDPVTGLPRTVVSDAPGSGAGAEERDGLSSAAQQAHVRSQAALDDFRDSAPAGAAASYDSTVTGPEVERAEKYLAALTDAPTLSDAELDYSSKKLGDALTARVDQMRGAEAALGDQRVKHLEQLRDDDVTGLEIRIALVGFCLLAAVGVAMGAARSLTRPLAVLRRGSARLAGEPGTGEPIAFTGRDDEFAQVVRSVNALHAHAVALHERLGTLESDRKHLIGERQRMADDRDALRRELADAAAQLDKARHSIHGTFVNLALRTLGLVERQLGVIEGLEEREQDPERLGTLFKLDHFATVMRRHSENLLVLAGAEHGQQHAGSVPLVDVVRAAVSEIERYERVRIAALPPHAHIAGFAADDLSHLVAELLENATSFSPPDASVEVSGWLLENGEVMLSVQDEGIGMAEDRMRELNGRLSAFSAEQAHDPEDTDGLGLGLYVVARLAARHGVRVRLREQKQGGVAAVAVLPTALFAAAPAASVPPAVPMPGGAPAVHLPGSEAEANSNVLDGRSGDEDPLIAAAEQAVRQAGDTADAPADTEPAEDASAAEATAPVEPALPVERPAETTMELLAPVPPPAHADEPDAHERTPDEAVTESAPAAPQPGTAQSPTQTRPEPDHAPEPVTPEVPAQRAPDSAPAPQRLTDKGLPKRTPKAAAQAPAPKPRTGSVDADALRRRLGGFHRGAQEGRKDVAAEIEERIGEAKGDPAEEASS
ncbi:histidine kinase [Streptomyces sp. SID5785]|uniref:sensor histidine kinase n=1 Tax=Streptomyces sp. SID5785 TaxID=2690309 RepID=UPI001361A214|nr:nitrate- and nitrite sensing domain-containing protein [Streptomyces sp. SID5785]MZD10111.1 histidine kinase [Streptomyces sp. SID5785]